MTEKKERKKTEANKGREGSEPHRLCFLYMQIQSTTEAGGDLGWGPDTMGV